MSQEIINEGEIQAQFNIGANTGPIYNTKPTRWSKRFQKLKEEVESNALYGQVIDDFLSYNTARDGLSTENKLKDGNFNDREILDAIIRKERYFKKLEKNKNYEAAQKIDTEIFALIKLNFDTYVVPLIESNETKGAIRQKVTEAVINPILTILNDEGSEDDFLNYSADDILGMLYFLTGKCHINWTKYDHL